VRDLSTGFEQPLPRIDSFAAAIVVKFVQDFPELGVTKGQQTEFASVDAFRTKLNTIMPDIPADRLLKELRITKGTFKLCDIRRSFEYGGACFLNSMIIKPKVAYSAPPEKRGSKLYFNPCYDDLLDVLNKNSIDYYPIKKEG
jgi:hypothetical protein